MENRTISLGTLGTGKAARKALQDAGRYVVHPPGPEIPQWNSVTDVLDRIDYQEPPAQATVRVVSGEDLGLEDGYTLDELLERASAVGLRGSPEAGVATAVEYEDQPSRELILVASRPIPDRHGNPWVLGIYTSGDGGTGPSLVGHHCLPHQSWPKSALWLFVAA